MFDDFIVRAALAGVVVAAAAGPLGCFVVWRRMAYFGDATAHAAVLGVAISLGFSMSIIAGVLVTSLAMALAISALEGRGLAADTLLGVFSHSALAAGILAASLMTGLRVDLSAYLIGDILAISKQDLIVISAGSVAVVALLCWRWNKLLTVTLNPDLAEASGISARREQLFLTVALALLVAVAIKLVGALLITALLIIPAAAARPLARSPETMAVMASVAGVFSAVAGLWVSFQADTPTGPTIVCTAAALFFSTALFKAFSNKKG